MRVQFGHDILDCLPGSIIGNPLDRVVGHLYSDKFEEGSSFKLEVVSEFVAEREIVLLI